METFRLVSKPTAYDIPSDASPHRAVLNGMQVIEEWTDHPDSGLPRGVKAYCIAIEAQVNTLAEVRDAWGRASDLSDELDQVWPYVAGEPLLPLILTIRLRDDVDGWSSNLRELERHFARLSGSPLGHAEVINRHWTKMPSPPLSRAIDALDQLRLLSGAKKLLHELYYSSLKSLDRNAQMFILAKCLEIVRTLLAGRNDAQRHDNLDPIIQQSVTRSLHDLIGLANHRLNVRHVVENPVGPTFHPEMTGQELSNFIADAGTIVRGLMCGYLGVPVFKIRPYGEPDT